ncbi:hypothetical protein DFH11DRAFT_869890 [Phellopilus nigrolimitatus]|nr:hypothetical protein DFH11DRAFT_869890 [Phellopilus nigrolimitatus]
MEVCTVQIPFLLLVIPAFNFFLLQSFRTRTPGGRGGREEADMPMTMGKSALSVCPMLDMNVVTRVCMRCGRGSPLTVCPSEKCRALERVSKS